MKPATLPYPEPGAERLLHVDPERGVYAHHRIVDLPALLSPFDLLVVNDAATLPASLRVASRDIEVRLARRGDSDAAWTAVLLGSGDFHTPTEQRALPPRVSAGEQLDFGGGLAAEVISIDAELPRLLDIHFNLEGAALFRALYQQARPVQYAYLKRELSLWDFQNRFAARPWALELPSAGHCLTWEILLALRARGVGVAHLTHAAGLSSTGSSELDRRFPLPERYAIEASAVEAIRATKKRGGRVVAVGTTVVRALEANHLEHGRLTPGPGEARLLIGPGFRPQVADAILSGMHDSTTSHFALLGAFASGALLEQALEAAERAEYLQHEFGDTMLVLST
jgi:S-adenosylmethionine:tRNA ribosyltransferase-isomerase